MTGKHQIAFYTSTNLDIKFYMKIIFNLLIFIMLIANSCHAQKQYNPSTISTAIQILFKNYLTNFKSLNGAVKSDTYASFTSKLKLPNSVSNRIEIASSTDYPLIFISLIPAGNDKNVAVQKQKEICAEILATKITIDKKEYNIVFIPEESNMENEEYVFVYKVENAPAKYLEARVAIRLDPIVKKNYKYKFTFSVAYVESSYKY